MSLSLSLSTTSLFFPSFISALLLICGGARGDERRIGSAEEFINFANDVNNRTNHLGTTVYLDADLDFSGKEFVPVGNTTNSNKYFKGTFNGQGYVISNLAINPLSSSSPFSSSSSSQYTGLFGCLYGSIIKNVVLDDSCSIESSFSESTSSNKVYVGGIVGYYYMGTDIEYPIENIVNMVSVTFSGSGDSDLYLGGIAGSIQPYSSYTYTMRNCANYGTVTHSGSSNVSYIGGIVGFSGASLLDNHIQNCFNYGTISHTGTSVNYLFMGGIVGYGYKTPMNVDNCLSAGEISSSGTTPSNTYISTIVGHILKSNVSINHCYWTSDVGGYNMSSGRTPLNTTGTPDTPVSAEKAVSNLNSRVTLVNRWSKWLLNTNGASVTFKVGNSSSSSNSEGFTTKSHVVLLPDIAGSNGLVFGGWFSDALHTEPFLSTEVTGDTTLYGLYALGITVTFDVNGGNELVVKEKEVTFNCKYGELPTPTRDGYLFIGWFTENNQKVTSDSIVGISKNHTLIAQWGKIIIVTFDVNGGNELVAKEKEVTFNCKYGELPTPTRDGYLFIGWFTEDNQKVTSDSIVDIQKNHTLTARWEEITNQVEIVFNSKDLTKEDVEKIIEQYTPEKFTIAKFESSETGKLIVIVAFTNTAAAEEFVRNVRQASRDKSVNSLITRINFNSERLDDASLAQFYHPLITYLLYCII